MKNIILILSLYIYNISNAQQPIIPLYNGSDLFDTPNAYYKDTYDDLTKVEGTWQYTNNNEIFIIKLKKIYSHFYNDNIRNIQFYEDRLYGEYKYINTNNEVINNTLQDMSNGFTNFNDYTIFGSHIMGKYDTPICNQCNENEKRLNLFISDPQRNYFQYSLYVRYIPKFNEPDQIKIIIKNESHIVFMPENQPSNHRLPVGQEFTLTKVE